MGIVTVGRSLRILNYYSSAKENCQCFFPVIPGHLFDSIQQRFAHRYANALHADFIDDFIVGQLGNAIIIFVLAASILEVVTHQLSRKTEPPLTLVTQYFRSPEAARLFRLVETLPTSQVPGLPFVGESPFLENPGMSSSINFFRSSHVIRSAASIASYSWILAIVSPNLTSIITSFFSKVRSALCWFFSLICRGQRGRPVSRFPPWYSLPVLRRYPWNKYKPFWRGINRRQRYWHRKKRTVRGRFKSSCYLHRAASPRSPHRKKTSKPPNLSYAVVFMLFPCYASKATATVVPLYAPRSGGKNLRLDRTRAS